MGKPTPEEIRAKIDELDMQYPNKSTTWIWTAAAEQLGCDYEDVLDVETSWD